MVLGLLDQLQISWQLCVIELLGRSTGLRLLKHSIFPRLLIEFGMLLFFTNVGLMEFQVRYLALFLLFSVIDDFRWFWMGSLYKNMQSMLKFLQGSILGPTISQLYINDLPDDVTCNITIYAVNTTLWSKRDQASDLWQQLELASEFESDLRDTTVDWGQGVACWFQCWKIQLVSFDRSNKHWWYWCENGWVCSWRKIIF